MVRNEILETAFEQVDGKWVWYPRAFSRGVVVSSEERDLYLAFRPFAFRKAVAGRPATQPRRPYFPPLKKVLRAIFSAF